MATTLRVFTGPPGTGKTYRAVREAIALLDGKAPGSPSNVRSKFRAFVADGRIVPVTFHPSYSYEDFVEGYRPQVDASGRIQYVVVPGPFLRAVARARGTTASARGVSPYAAYFKVGDVVQAPRGPRYRVVEVTPEGVALESEVDRTDAVTERSIGFVDFWSIERLRVTGVKPDELTPSGQQNERRQEFARKTMLPTTFLTNAGRHRAVYVRLLELGGAKPGSGNAATKDAAPVVLFIDEINRADLSRVFGELITLLEPDKREGAIEERSVLLPYSQMELTVPADLHIVATMNTADRSLSVFDYALRRRFEFVQVEPEPSMCPKAYAGIDVAAFLRRVNDVLGPLLGRNLTIGHAELMEAKLEEVRTRSGYAADDDGKARAVAAVLTTKIIPYLLDAFTDDWRRVEQVLGTRGLLQSVKVGPDEEDEDEFVDIADRAFRIAPWAAPDSSAFDAAKVRAALNPPSSS